MGMFMYYQDSDGIYVPQKPVTHRNDEFVEDQFAHLFEMQSKHFWYLGRHRFLLESLKRHQASENFSAIDLGGGCGGWVQYLTQTIPNRLTDIALADSSRVALLNAKGVLDEDVDLYHVDLMDLQMQEQWNTTYLLDVIEHCPDDVTVMRQAAKAMKPGGKLFVATPALDFFWSYNDEFVKHVRRYDKPKYQELAKNSGLILKDARYFMFFLSPLYWLSRKTRPKKLNEGQMAKLYKEEYKTPHPIINNALKAMFYAETPLGHHLSFPWGTSILGVFEKPKN
jgi:2-polyprenyl-3-methyl-5-hydroxy-6-metoxy-1,4-benzoquinol methylase